MKHRVCREPACVTVLSHYNSGDRCWTHTPDIGPKLASTYKIRNMTSEAFVANVQGAYHFTATERRRYKEGG